MRIIEGIYFPCFFNPIFIVHAEIGTPDNLTRNRKMCVGHALATAHACVSFQFS